MTPPRFTVEVLGTASGYAVGLVVGDRDGRMQDYPDPVAVKITADHAAYLHQQLGASGGMPPVLVTDRLARPRPLHAVRYAAWYRLGLPTLRVLARLVPLHYADALAERYARLGRYHDGGHLTGGGAMTGYLIDRVAEAYDAEHAIRTVVAARARRALGKVDRARAIADPREVTR